MEYEYGLCYSALKKVDCTTFCHNHLVFFTVITSLSLRNCWTVLTMTMNQKLEKKQRRMKSHHSPLCKLLIYYICHSMSDARRWEAFIVLFRNEIKAVKLMPYFYHHSMQQPPAFPQHMEHFKPQMINMSQDPSQQVRTLLSAEEPVCRHKSIHLIL